MSTVKTDNVVGSFTPLPVINSANAVETYIASAGQTVFTTTKFDQTSAIKVFAKATTGFTELAATWTGTNTLSVSGVTLTVGQKVYVYSVGDTVLRRDLTNTSDLKKGAVIIGRSTVSIDNVSDLLSVKQDPSLRYLVKGFHVGSDIGGGEFYWDATRLRSTHNGGKFISPSVPAISSQAGVSISEKTANFLAGVGDTASGNLGCFVLNAASVTPEQFGAFRGVETLTVTAIGSQVSKSSGSFSAADVGKKIQIFKAGSANTSHASFIESVASGVATLRTPVATNVTSLPAHVGFCSYYQFRAMVDFVQGAGGGVVRASGTYLFASNNGNITLGQQMNLSADGVDYDFKGSTFYGMLLLVRVTGGTVFSVKNSKLHGHKIVCLGDGLDALVGNTNWNAVAAIAQNSSIYDFDVSVIGGCRGISAQSSSTQGLISNLDIYNFTLTADPVYGQTCDAIDISAGLPNLISGVTVRDGKTYNFGKIIGVSNSDVSYTNKDVTLSNIEAFGACKKAGNINRTDGFSVSNIKIHAFTDEGFIVNSCDNGDVDDLNGTCTGTAASMLTVTDSRSVISGDSNIRVNRLKGQSTLNKFTRGTLVHGAHGVHVSDSDLNDGAYGVYDGGYSGSFDNVRFRRNTANIRPVSGSLLNFKDCVQIADATRPTLVDESGGGITASVVFDGTGADASAMTLRRSHNVASVTRISAGVYDVLLKRSVVGIPMVSGCGRQFGGVYTFATYGGIPGTNALTIRVALVTPSGTTAASDYVTIFIK